MKYELEEPFIEEKGKITSPIEIGGNRSQTTFSAEGAMRGNIEVTNIGDFVGVSRGNNVTHAQGQGVNKVPYMTILYINKNSFSLASSLCNRYMTGL
jgi:hypothetical protein